MPSTPAVVPNVGLVVRDHVLPRQPRLPFVRAGRTAAGPRRSRTHPAARRLRVLRSARLADPGRHDVRSSSATHSTCGVCGNMSTGACADEPVAVVVGQALRVAGERRRVARDVDDPRRADLAEPLERLAGEPGARAGRRHDGRVAGPLAELAEHLADVAGEERGVADRVQLGVLDRARDRLLADLDAPHRQRVRGRARGRSCRSRSRGRRPSRRR